MAEAADTVFEVESPFASGLVRALESIRNEGDQSLLVSWLATYRAEELHSGQFIADRAERFKKVDASFASFFHSYRICKMYRADGAAREYLRGMEIALTKIIAIDEGMSQDPEELRTMLQSEEFEALAKRLTAIASADAETATRRYIEGYEHRLLENGFLMEELIRVLCVEYNARVESARTRFATVVQPLSENARRIGRQIADIDRNIEDLSRDENVSTQDRRIFLETFEGRRAELATSLKTLQGKAPVVSALLADYRSVTSRASAFLAKLKVHLAQLAARRDYLRRLSLTGSQAPKLAVIEEAGESLQSNAGTLQDAFLLLDDGFLDEILAVFESERTIGSVTVRLKETPEIAFVVSPQPPIGETLPRFDLSSFVGLSARVASNGRTPRGSHRSRRSIRPVGDQAARPGKDAQ